MARTVAVGRCDKVLETACRVIHEWSDVEAQWEWVEQMPPNWVPYIVRAPYSPYSDFPRAQRNPRAIPA
jgi:hypothetical protein